MSEWETFLSSKRNSIFAHSRVSPPLATLINIQSTAAVDDQDNKNVEKVYLNSRIAEAAKICVNIYSHNKRTTTLPLFCAAHSSPLMVIDSSISLECEDTTVSEQCRECREKWMEKVLKNRVLSRYLKIKLCHFFLLLAPIQPRWSLLCSTCRGCCLSLFVSVSLCGDSKNSMSIAWWTKKVSRKDILNGFSFNIYEKFSFQRQPGKICKFLPFLWTFKLLFFHSFSTPKLFVSSVYSFFSTFLILSSSTLLHSVRVERAT